MADRLSGVAFGDEWRACGEPTPDVMSVRSRMAMYRKLVESTNDHGGFGEAGELSPFWGYASQLAWQQRSGRLGAMPSAIDPSSWWGACNYALSVIPYVAAMQLGIVPTVAIRHDHAYDGALLTWHDAFGLVTTSSHDHDAIRLAVWRAHLESITLAVRLHQREYRMMPAGERRFARGWIRMVDLFAAAALRTDLDKLLETGGGALPSRVLHDDSIADLPRYERSTVRRVGALADRPPWRWLLDITVWRRIMRTRNARADAERLLAAMLGSGDHVWRGRLRAVAYAALPARLLELR